MSKLVTIYANGTREERDLTEAELAQMEADKLAYEAGELAKQQVILKREAALAKLQALGLDEDDLKALGL